MHLSSFVRVLAVAALTTTAVSAAAAPPSGCFERVYSDEHMRDHPKQMVRRMIVSIGWDDYYKQNIFGVKAWLRSKKQVWRAGGSCDSQADPSICRPDTDGAPDVYALMNGDTLEFSIPRSLKIFDDVTGPGLNEDWIRGPEDATFLLARARAANCKSK